LVKKDEITTWVSYQNYQCPLMLDQIRLKLIVSDAIMNLLAAPATRHICLSGRISPLYSCYDGNQGSTFRFAAIFRT
jgi:hypothetical protein